MADEDLTYGDELIETPGVEDEKLTKAVPPRGLGTRLTERFWGTDIEKDPQQWTRLGTIITAAVAGSHVGSKFPLNPIAGAIIGGATGALSGAVWPEMAMDIGETLGIIPEGYRDRHGLTNEELRVVAEGEALLDLATGGGIFLARLAGRGFTRALVKPGKEGDRLAGVALKNNIAVLPVQVGQRRLPRQMVSVFGRFPFLFRPFAKASQKAEDDLARAYATLPTRIAPMASMTEVSADIMSEAGQFARNVDAAFQKEFDRVLTQADQLGVQVVPSATMTRTKEVLASIIRRSPKAVDGGTVSPNKELSDVARFLTDNLMPMQMRDEASGAVLTAKQSLRQMDTLLTKVEEQMKAFHLAGKDEAFNILGDIKQQLLLDMQMNTRGVGAASVLQEYRMVDQAYSQTWQELFENATAKRFGSIRRRGLAGIQYTDDKTIPVDKLGDVIMRGDSPQIVEDLHKLINQSTFNKLASSVLDAKIQSSFSFTEDGSRAFQSQAFADAMGITNKSSARYETMSRMLELSGGLKMKEVEELLDLSMAIDSVPIPNVSTFIARRASIGGMTSVIRGLIPGAVVGVAGAGGAAAAGGALSLGGLIGGVMFVGGNRLLAKMISNPSSAQILRRVMKQESADLVSKAALTRAGRLAIWSLMQDDIDQQPLGPAGVANRVGDVRQKFIEMDSTFVDFINSWWSEARRELRKSTGTGAELKGGGGGGG